MLCCCFSSVCWWTIIHWSPGGGSFTKIVRGCHISIPFLKEKHPIWIKLGAFYNNLPKIHPIYAFWAPSSLMKTPRSLYQISRKSAPKGRHIYVYHVNVRTPPPGTGVQSTILPFLWIFWMSLMNEWRERRQLPKSCFFNAQACRSSWLYRTWSGYKLANQMVSSAVETVSWRSVTQYV